jgi:uncharacterized membrane-anchored protein YitT (DUF2179 family)
MKQISIKKLIVEYLLIVAGSIIYALSTVCFIFPMGLFLGGTSGVSVILASFIENTPGIIFTVINALLLIAALIVLGKSMAIKTFVGSTVTTILISIFEQLFNFDEPIIANLYLSAAIGAALIAIASGILFYVDSSSGGTDIIALIIKKFSDIKIGKALLITDLLIVIVGGILSGYRIAIASFAGLLIKTLGIDLVIKLVNIFRSRQEKP